MLHKLSCCDNAYFAHEALCYLHIGSFQELHRNFQYCYCLILQATVNGLNEYKRIGLATLYGRMNFPT